MIIQLEILNIILSTHDFSFIVKNNITADYFPNLKGEFLFIYNHYKEYGQVPDLATFLDKYPEFEVLEVNESTEYLVSELYKEKNENYAVTTFNKFRELIMKGKNEEAMTLFSQASHGLTEGKRLEAVNILQDISRYDAYLDKCNNFDKYFIPTGFRELDDSLGGGIDRKNAYFVISARPGIGKTLVLVKFAAAAVQKGLRVGFYEGEMTVDKIAGRYDSLTSHISNGSINHGNIGVSNQYKRYLENLKSSEGEFYILTRDMIDGNKVTVDTLETFVDKYKLDILFVDQLSLLDSRLKYGKSFELAAEISKDLKNLQVRKHIPIVVASQQNRAALEDGKMASTDNIAQSDRISADATEIIFLSKVDDILKINIAKARDGAKKYLLQYSINFDKGEFTYIPDESDQPTEQDEEEDRPLNINYNSGEAVF